MQNCIDIIWRIVIISVLAGLWGCKESENIVKDTANKKLAVLTIVPEKGRIGCSLKIFGNNLNPEIDSNEVFIGNSIKIPVDSLSLGSPYQILYCHIPPGSTSGKITVKAGNDCDSSEETFNVIENLKPHIIDFTPKTAIAGSTVQITGENFSPVLSENEVYFGEICSSVDIAIPVYNPTELYCKVPSNSKNCRIVIKIGDYADTSETDFVVAKPAIPEIDSLSPKKGKEGTLFKISGRNFSPRLDENIIIFNGGKSTKAQAVNPADNPTEIWCRVPEYSQSGKIIVRIGTYSDTSNDSFLVTPSVFDFSPKRGVPGTEVKISGRHFGTNPMAIRVFFDKKYAFIYSITDTELTVKVPKGLYSYVNIYVEYEKVTERATGMFEVLP
ncbi:MAG: hypothetical protein QG635_2006 [Bacteroidota bacterium]|nr:hypothetical protein [Bacteroidota bacterium]